MGLLTHEKRSLGRAPAPPARGHHLSPPWPASRHRKAPLPSSAPAGDGPSATPSRFKRIAAFLARPPLWATLVVCAGILVARRPELFLHPQFWAEDGTLFFAEGWTHGARTLLMPYAGYLHTAQRLVTLLALLFDPRWAPAIFVGGASALTLYVAARTQSSRLPFRPQVAFALAVVLVPDAFEVLLFLVNIQWVLAGGLLLLLVSADASRLRQHVH
ncbi:MAG: hypothetical protein NTV51_07765, partial [Verrucomicrobia bacterium]|nr:hypothetical protein [Verrucomicrobiota bacterium]